MLEWQFGATTANADGRIVPVRPVGEQHVREDLGSIPSFVDWARLITPQAWMLRGHLLDEPVPVDGDKPAAGDALCVKLRPASGRAVRIEV